jgi:predicted MFS family arabinose efflux permease
MASTSGTVIMATNVTRSWTISFIAVVLAMMTMQMSSLGFAPLLPDIQKTFGMSYSQLGTFTGVYGLVAIVLSIPAGILAKRYGEKSVLASGLFVLTLGLLALSIAQTYIGALSSRVLWIVGYRFAFIAVMTAVALTVPPRFKGQAMGIIGAMAAAASVIGAPFGTSIGGAFGWRHGIMAFAAASFLGMLVLLIFYRSAPEGANGAADIHGHGSLHTGGGNTPSIFAAFKIPIVWTIPLLGLTNVGGFAATFFVPSVLRSEFHLDAAAGSHIISISYLAAIVVNPICGYLTDRFDRWLVLASLVALMVPGGFAMMSHNLLVFQVATASLVSLGLAVTNQLYPTIAELMRGRDVGPLMGITALGGGLFGYLGPQALGWLRDWSGGFNAGWYAVTGAAAFVLGLILYLKHYHDQRDAD